MGVNDRNTIADYLRAELARATQARQTAEAIIEQNQGRLRALHNQRRGLRP